MMIPPQAATIGTGRADTMKLRSHLLSEITDVTDLRDGDIVQHRGTGEAYIVIHNDGRTVTATRTRTVTNPQEWWLYTGKS
jgi:hypothetical protein